ncbi:FAD-binding protein [Streptomyces sp. NPDC005921]
MSINEDAYDVIVVGSGGGLVGAYVAASRGLRTLVVEKLPWWAARWRTPAPGCGSRVPRPSRAPGSATTSRRPARTCGR